MKNTFVLVMALLLLAACGGGGNNSVSAFESPTLTAYYVDAPVKGLIYEASPSGLSGVTDETGAFKFKQGDAVSLFIDSKNRIYIGKVFPISQEKVFVSSGVNFDPLVDHSMLPLLFFTLDLASQSTSFMDVSSLSLKPEVAEKIKLLLRKDALPNGISDPWLAMSSLQLEESSYTFKNTGSDLNVDRYNEQLFKSVKALDSVIVDTSDFNGIYSFSYAGVNAYLSFEANGIFRSLDDSGIISNGSYAVVDGQVLLSWNDRPSNTCEISFTLKKRQPRMGLVFAEVLQHPLGCANSFDRFEVFTKSKIRNETAIDLLAGKVITLPLNGFCGLGIGNVTFQIATSGDAIGRKNFNMSASECTGNTPQTGTVRNSGIPGVVVFEFDDAVPRVKLFFSIADDGKTAYTLISRERTSPDVGFDAMYGTETSFSID